MPVAGGPKVKVRRGFVARLRRATNPRRTFTVDAVWTREEDRSAREPSLQRPDYLGGGAARALRLAGRASGSQGAAESGPARHRLRRAVAVRFARDGKRGRSVRRLAPGRPAGLRESRRRADLG